MIRLTFAYILYSLHIVCIYKKHTKAVSVSQLYRFCMVCTLFVVQKTYEGHFSQLVVQILYGLYIICSTKNIRRPFQLASCIDFVQFAHIVRMYKKRTFQVSSRFQSDLCASFVQFVQFLYICKNLMYIFCIFIIIQNIDLYNLCIQNIYKLSVLYNFCISLYSC